METEDTLQEQQLEEVNGGIPEKIVLVCEKDCIIREDLSNVSAAPEQR